MENFIFWAVAGKIFCSSFDKNTFENCLVVPKKMKVVFHFLKGYFLKSIISKLRITHFPYFCPLLSSNL